MDCGCCLMRKGRLLLCSLAQLVQAIPTNKKFGQLCMFEGFQGLVYLLEFSEFRFWDILTPQMLSLRLDSQMLKSRISKKLGISANQMSNFRGLDF